MQDVSEIKKKYKLNDTEFEKMYQDSRTIVFENLKTYEKPIAILIGGQTGAGKGGIDVYSKKEFKEKKLDIAVIDVDVFRMLHPKAKEIVKKYPTLYTEITGQETSKIAKLILEETIKKGYNFIFEGTMKNTEILDTMKNLMQKYTKVIRVMATSAEESLLTAFERNEEQIKLIGYGRFTNVEVHDFSYKGVAETLKIIEESGVPNKIEIFTRGKDIVSPDLIYSSDKKNNQFNTAYESLIQYRKINKALIIDTIPSRLERILNSRSIDKREEQQRIILENRLRKVEI